MIKFVIPAILIGISAALFFGFADPIYNEISGLKTQSAAYNQALSNSKQLEMERDRLTAKYNAIDQQNIQKLEKLLPDSVDNIRLILEIEKIAALYGMSIKDVKYNSKEENNASVGQRSGGGNVSAGPYGIWNLQFSTNGTYDNFVRFLEGLEKNLRIVDVSSINFTAQDVPGLNSSIQRVYKYDITLKTYWLKS